MGKASAKRRVRCVECGARVAVEAAVERECPECGALLRRRERAPVGGCLVGALSLLLALAFVPLAFLGASATAGEALDGGAAGATTVGLQTIVFCIFAAGFAVGGIGAFLAKAWAWWTVFVLHGFNALWHAKLATPLFHINWDHPRAWEAAAPYLLVNGVPFVVSVAALSLLVLPGMRRAYGVKQRELVRPSRRVRRDARE